MLEIAGGRNVFADVKQQAVQASTEMLIASKPEVIVELLLRRQPQEHGRREGAARLGRAGVGAGRPLASHRRPDRRRVRRPRPARRRRDAQAGACASSGRCSNEDARVVVERQGQRVDGARPAAARRRRDRRAADDDQRAGAAGGDARGARRGAAGAGRGARLSALDGADSVAVPERGLRRGDARGGRARGARRLHPRRVRRSVPRGHPEVPRGAARRQRPDADVSAVRHRRRHAGPRARR